MKISDINKKKIPIVRIDKSLNKYDDVILFPEKVAKANEMLRTIGLPKLRTKKRARARKKIARVAISKKVYK